jgi:hypothetical protein
VHGPCANCCCSRIGCITVRLSPETRPDPTVHRHPASVVRPRRVTAKNAPTRSPSPDANAFRPFQAWRKFPSIKGALLYKQRLFFSLSPPSPLQHPPHNSPSAKLLPYRRAPRRALRSGNVPSVPSFLSNPTLPWSPRKGFHLNPARACLDSERLRCVLLELTGDVADDGQQPE